MNLKQPTKTSKTTPKAKTTSVAITTITTSSNSSTRRYQRPKLWLLPPRTVLLMLLLPALLLLHILLPKNNFLPRTFLLVAAQTQSQNDTLTSTQKAYRYGLADHAFDHASETHSKSLIVNIPSLGKVQGKRDQGIDFYGGIPYAAPPVGQLRFAPPEPPPPWAPVILDGTHYGADCWQIDDPVMNPGALKDYMSEDCLSLNVFTPAGHVKKSSTGGILFDSAKKQQDKLLPVLVWLHGGAFQQGGARRPEYDGRRLAERDVIVVTLNYRLGALGFLVSSSGKLYTTMRILLTFYVAGVNTFCRICICVLTCFLNVYLLH